MYLFLKIHNCAILCYIQSHDVTWYFTIMVNLISNHNNTTDLYTLQICFIIFPEFLMSKKIAFLLNYIKKDINNGKKLPHIARQNQQILVLGWDTHSIHDKGL